MDDLLTQSSKATIKNKNGEEITDTTKLIATGNIVTIDGVDYKVVKLGDVSGDGVLDVIDLTLMKRHILKIRIIDDEYLQAGNLDNVDGIDIIDLTLLKRHMLNIRYITM